jgi:hypothetical protein
LHRVVSIARPVARVSLGVHAELSHFFR